MELLILVFLIDSPLLWTIMYKTNHGPQTTAPVAAIPTITATSFFLTPISLPSITPTPALSHDQMLPTLVRDRSQYLDPIRIDGANLSIYFTPMEEEYSDSVNAPVPANKRRGYRFLSEEDMKYTNDENFSLVARRSFLYDPIGLCSAGSGRLISGVWISCTELPENIPYVGFEYLFPNDTVAAFTVRPFETVAVCNNYDITPFRQGDVIEVPEIRSYMLNQGHDEFFLVTDTGQGLCHLNHPTMDIFLGLGRQVTLDNRYLMNIDATTVYIHRPLTPD